MTLELEDYYYQEIQELVEQTKANFARIRYLKNAALQDGNCTHKHSETYVRTGISGLEHLTQYPAGTKLRYCLVCAEIFKEKDNDTKQ